MGNRRNSMRRQVDKEYYIMHRQIVAYLVTLIVILSLKHIFI